MTKPDWKDAPEWAQWLAMDEHGSWFWYERKPSRDNDCGNWQASYGVLVQEAGEALPDWTMTLTPRPKESEHD